MTRSRGIPGLVVVFGRRRVPVEGIPSLVIMEKANLAPRARAHRASAAAEVVARTLWVRRGDRAIVQLLVGPARRFPRTRLDGAARGHGLSETPGTPVRITGKASAKEAESVGRRRGRERGRPAGYGRAARACVTHGGRGSGSLRVAGESL
uniref:Uncharacterized protein n=1 Tax=Human herpesvirus 2 TaxID=10310 RepID=A0A481TBV8_HHV2|nr:hypothetical protein [Human alphaherpesvirus 2]